MNNGKKVIAIDFDGTLHDYFGWNGDGLEALNDPIENMRRLVYDLQLAGCEVVVFSAREPRAIIEWLVKHDFPSLEITNIKEPKFDVIIDDRALHFDPSLISGENNYDNFLYTIVNFRPHFHFSPKYKGTRT